MSEHNANEMLKVYPYLNYYNAKKIKMDIK